MTIGVVLLTLLFMLIVYYRHEIKIVTSGYRVALTFNLCIQRPHRSNETDLQQHVTKKARLADPIVLSDLNNSDNTATNDDVEDESPDDQLPSAALNSQHSPIVRRLAKAFQEWYDVKEPRSVLIPLSHRYTKGTLARNTLKTSDKALMSLIDHAIDLSRTESAFKQVGHPPVIPLLCHLTCTLSGTEECEEDFETSYDVSHIVPLPLIPVSRPLNLFNSLVHSIKLSDDDFDVIYTDPDFDWDNEKPDDKERAWTGNEGVSVEKFYHKTGILLVNAACRLDVIASSMPKSSLIDTVSDLFAMPERCADASECMNWARTVYRAIPSNMLPSFLLALSNLKKTAPDNLATESEQSFNDEAVSLMNEIFETSYIDFDSDTIVSELNQFAAAEGIEWVAPLLTSAFERHLTCETKHRRLSIEDGSKFLLELFAVDYSSVKNAFKRRKSTAAAASLHWAPFVTNMCSALYTQVQNQPAPNLLSSSATYSNLLKLLCMHWAYLMSDRHTFHNDEMQKCVKTAQWVSRCVFEFMNEHTSPRKDIKEKLDEEILPDFIIMLEDMIQQTNTNDEEDRQELAEAATLRSAFLSLVQCIDAYLTSQIADPLPPNDWTLRNRVSCSCKDCKLLNKFLKSPTEKQIDIHTIRNSADMSKIMLHII